ncbi:MAG TPA: lipopolysaccharide biosynthesis protein [Gaiellaceae bacterium]
MLLRAKARGEDAMTDARSPEPLGSRIRSGIAWKVASQVTLQLSRMVVALVLARLLAPHDWGLAAMVFVFSGFVVVFTDNAFGTALIQRRELHPGDRSTVFWISAGLGLLLALVGIGLSGLLADYYREPEVRPLFAAVSVGFLVSALGTTHSALLAREMRFRRLELRQIAATLTGATAGITLAVSGFGAWAIVGQQLTEGAVSTVLLWCLLPWRPSLSISMASIRRLGGFAGNVFGENLLYQAGRNLGTLLIGRFVGAAALGAYALATNVILVPFSRLAGPLQQVFFPAFSRMSSDRERIADVWIRASRLVGTLAFPALTGLVIVAPDFVHVVLGDRWARATVIIQILAWVGLIQSLQTLNGEVLMALGKAGTLLRFTALWFVVTVAAFVIGLHWGIVGVALSYAISTALIEPLRTWVTTRALEISFWRFVRAFAGIAQATVFMAVVLIPARLALIGADVQPAARLVLLVLLGGAAYGLGCFLRAHEVVDEVRGVLRPRRHVSIAPSEPLSPRLSQD